MQGNESNLRKTLEGTKQFIIPAYQRPYAWGHAQWDALWTPVARQAEKHSMNAIANPYFLGSLVLHKRVEQSDLPRYDVIDGQQRLTTVIALLTALRDATEGKLREQIDEQILRNKFADGDNQLKVLPKASDSSDMHSLVLEHEAGTGKIGLAHKFFTEKIASVVFEKGVTSSHIAKAVLDGLIIVEITTDQNDNPHRIFQTLNSTGVGLEEVDKLRSHFFMLLPNDHENAHSAYWKPMEQNLGSGLGRFLHVDVVSWGSGHETTKTSDVYARWRDLLAGIEFDEDAIRERLVQLHGRSKLYRRMTAPSGSHPIDVRLARLEEWGTIHRPLAYFLLRRHAEGVLDDAGLEQALRVVESYLVRRMLVGRPTNNLNRMFTTTIGQISAEKADLVATLRRSLSEPAKGWPTDETLREVAVTSDFYLMQQSNQRQFVLRRLEEDMSIDGHVDWSSAKFTIEHFMPQNLSPAWRDALQAQGIADPQQAHQATVHLLGNLTLTSLNSKLSDFPADRKQEILQGSKLAMSDELKEVAAWGPDAIAMRTEHLVERAISIWEAPAKLDEEAPTDFSRVEDALRSLVSSEWTSLNELGGLVDASEVELLAHVNGSAADVSYRVLTAEGLPDIRLSWVSQGLAEALDRLVEVGVLESSSAGKAAPSGFVGSAELSTRIELD